MIEGGSYPSFVTPAEGDSIKKGGGGLRKNNFREGFRYGLK